MHKARRHLKDDSQDRVYVLLHQSRNQGTVYLVQATLQLQSSEFSNVSSDAFRDRHSQVDQITDFSPPSDEQTQEKEKQLFCSMV
jgi:hypothetical protein